MDEPLGTGIFCTACGWFESELMPTGERCNACGCPSNEHVHATVNEAKS